MLPFLLLPIWFLLTVMGFALLMSPNFRYLSAYLILCSTAGLLGSVLVSTAVLLLLFLVSGALEFRDPVAGILFTVINVVAALVGAGLGIRVGILLSARLNRWLGWREAPRNP